MAGTLATRCPACGTVFRVVPDQLRVSEGWVRCGRCSEVFNAAERLVDLETGGPSRDAARLQAQQAEVDTAAPARFTPAAASDFVGRAAPPPPPPPAPPPKPVAEEVKHRVPLVEDLESRFADDAAELTAKARADQAQMPSFVQRARRAERWRQPRVRAALALVALLAVLGLAAQVGHLYRDLVAARFPVLKPLLAQSCELLGCTVGPAHAIDSLAVDSSGLVRVEKSSLYKLTVALRNRAGIDVALPALELTLTDTQGKLLARRVLRAAEFGVTQPTLAAGRDLALQTTLQTQFQSGPEPVIAGYTIELFYP